MNPEQYMPQGNRLAKLIALLPVIVAVIFGLLFVYEVVCDPDYSVAAKLRGNLGAGEGRSHDNSRQGVALYERDVNMAMAQVNAYQNAYTQLWGAYVNLYQKFQTMEVAMFESQQKRLDDSNFVAVLGANASDFVALMGMAAGDQDLSEAGRDAGDDIRNHMLGNYPKMLTEHRSNIAEIMAAGLIPPDQLITPEYQRIMARQGE